MRLGVVDVEGSPQVFREDDDGTYLLPYSDIAELLSDPSWRAHRGKVAEVAPLNARLAPFLNPRPVICVGLNYGQHAAEMNKSTPEYPTLFAKFASALVGPQDDITLPPTDVSKRVDWEAELVIVVGRPVRNVSPERGAAAIFGYTIMNDVSVRDWQRRTEEWFQGKNFERTTPFGPVVITADEFDPAEGHRVETLVNGESQQDGRTDDLLFSPGELVSYISQFTTLRAGDMIATGTPAGVGAAKKPPRFLSDGDELVTRIHGIGELRNRCVIARVQELS